MSEERTLTFSQSQGYEAVPVPLRLEELSDRARTNLWNVLFVHLVSGSHHRIYMINTWELILKDVHAYHYNMPLDEWTTSFDTVCQRLRQLIERMPFNRVFDLIEYIMRHRYCPEDFIAQVSTVFKTCGLAYTIDVGPPVAILPATTPEEGAALERNLNDLRVAGLDGAAAHLQNAGKRINDGNWADSIRESIHSVESVARKINSRASKTLGPALNSLEKQGVLPHPALKEAFSKLYGYASDEKGIRHSLLDKTEANVTNDEALFMLGACASFASYLWRKHKSAAAS